MKNAIRITLPIILCVAVSCQDSGNNASVMFILESTVTPANSGSISPSGGSFDSDKQVQITANPTIILFLNSGMVISPVMIIPPPLPLTKI